MTQANLKKVYVSDQRWANWTGGRGRHMQ